MFKGFLLIGIGLFMLYGLPAMACDELSYTDDYCDPGFTCSDEPEPPIEVAVDIFEELANE
jgi:hypothetical protein